MTPKGPRGDAGSDLFARMVAHFHQGQLSEAESCGRRLLAADPKHVEALHLFGVIVARSGRYDAAIKSIGRAVALKPDFTEAHYHLGLAFFHQKRLEDAAASFRQALAQKPDFAQAHNDLGNALRDMGRLDDAVASYRRALAIGPRFAEAQSNLGIVYGLQGNWDEAVACHRQALALRPDLAEIHNNLGIALRERGELGAAEASYRRALALRPDIASAHSNLGAVLFDQDKLDEAAASYRRALALSPDFISAHGNLGRVLREQGKLEEALASHRRVVARAPDALGSLSEVVNLSRHLCDWRELDKDVPRLLAGVARAPGLVEPFHLLMLGADLELQRNNAQAWTQREYAMIAPRFAHPKPAADRKIRLGYLSADFRDHAIACLVAELFERHDRRAFEVFGYSIGPDDGSLVRQRLEQGFDHFVELRTLSNHDAAARIHGDGIDILVDLLGYTGRARTKILAERPAPITVNWLGFPGTMGASFMDYILVDAIVAPPADQRFFDEKLVHLPHCYQSTDTRRPVGPTPTRAECGLPDDAFVFCCFNNEYKITPPLFSIWMRLLDRVPGSVLWLLGSDVVKRNLGREAAARGIDPARLVFAPRQPLAQHLARHRLADLFLDTLPYTAHTTASDALWMELPVVTLMGDTFPGRVAASVLQAAGLPELVTRSEEAYESLAFALARDPSRLHALHQHLADGRSTTPLFDTLGFARGIERAYMEMWRRWRADLPPASFALSQDPEKGAVYP